jgi:hypothetical protein
LREGKLEIGRRQVVRINPALKARKALERGIDVSWHSHHANLQ